MINRVAQVWATVAVMALVAALGFVIVEVYTTPADVSYLDPVFNQKRRWFEWWQYRLLATGGGMLALLAAVIAVCAIWETREAPFD